MNNKLLKFKSFSTIFCAGILSLSINSAFAHNNPPPLDNVSFTLTAQEWAKTTTAKVTVGIHAALNKIALAKMRTQIMDNLNKIAKGNWHITSFERSQDSSGLEKLYVEAEARINEADLTNVNNLAKDISESGINYKIINVDFTPSLDDIEKVKKSLREKIYNEARAEIATLNNVYPEQKYTLHNVRFGEFVSSNGARTQIMMMATGITPQSSNVTVNTVSNLITLSADVDLASQMPKPPKAEKTE